MATELMKYNSSFCEKVDTHANYLPMWEALYDIDRLLQECDAELESIGLGIGYQSMEDDICLLGEQLNILQDFIRALPDRLSEKIDKPKEIQAKFALKYEPVYIGEVELKAGDTIRLGEAGPNFGFNGGGMQIDLQQQWIGNFIELGKIKDWRPYNG